MRLAAPTCVAELKFLLSVGQQRSWPQNRKCNWAFVVVVLAAEALRPENDDTFFEQAATGASKGFHTNQPPALDKKAQRRCSYPRNLRAADKTLGTSCCLDS